MGTPRQNDRILVLREPWLRMILAGEKTLEIRGRALASGQYWLGCAKTIHGAVVFGDPLPIRSRQEWEALRPRHRVDSHELPYKKTYGLPILSVRATRRVPYHHPKGAVGIVKYRHG